MKTQIMVVEKEMLSNGGGIGTLISAWFRLKLKSRLGSFRIEFAFSPCACLDFLWTLLSPTMCLKGLLKTKTKLPLGVNVRVCSRVTRQQNGDLSRVYPTFAQQQLV